MSTPACPASPPTPGNYGQLQAEITRLKEILQGVETLDQSLEADKTRLATGWRGALPRLAPPPIKHAGPQILWLGARAVDGYGP